LSERRVKLLLLLLGSSLSLLISLFPLFWMLLVSLSGSPDFLLTGKISITLENYVDLLTSPNLHFLDYLRNSLIVASSSALLSLILSTLSAYSLSRFSLPYSLLILMGVLAVSLFPQISAVGFLYRLFSDLGLINTYTALILPYTGWSLPLGLWLLHTYLSSIPRDIDRAAMIDGAGTLRILFQIILPLSLPGLVSTYILLFLFAFNEFLFALMFTVDYHTRTVPVGIALFEGLHGQLPWGYIMAASFISVSPVVLIVLILQKYIISGLTGGAVKG